MVFSLRSRRFSPPALLAGTIVLAQTVMIFGAEPDPQGVRFFEKSIRPVLVAQCYECHATTAKKIKGGLVLDNEAGLLTGGESGPAIVPGSPAKSLLIEALRHDGLEMPPEQKLPDDVIADFSKWIRMGAPYPRGAADDPDWAPRKDASREEALKFWSFQPIANPPAPPIKNEQWPRDDLDRFVLAAQEAAGVRPVADADPRTLLRRLYFDLIGLPPTPEQAEAFEKAAQVDRQQALARIVDELLKSPRFGEHWGRHWLDIARYAESNGNVDNELFPHAWRYRDWVINAFNNDMPWDRFITEQLAGDLMPYDSPRQRNEQLTATGFLTLTSKPRPQGNPNYQLDLVAEQIDTATMAFMALTVGCARCHDHKFDPIPTSEYYSMAAIFESTEMLHGSSGKQGNNKNKLASGGLLELASLDPGQAKAAREYDQQRTDLEQQLAKARREINNLTGTTPDKAAKNKAAAKAAKQAAKNKADKAAAAKKLSPEDRARLVELRQQAQDLQAKLEELAKQAPPAAGQCMGVRDRSKPVEGHVRVRGDEGSLGDAVPRGFTTIGYDGQPPRVDESVSGRLELAAWMASPNNTFTARVAVNRVWRHLFGAGIVKSVDNFGHLGEMPTNLELLDHLATRFIQEGWSVKQMIRAIALSHTYQLSSDHDAANYEKDPDNQWMWRHNVRRLDAEPLRDALLAVAGNLDVEPPAGSMVEGFGSILVQNGNQKNFAEYEHQHRSVYLPIVRSAEPEMLRTFDLPDPELVVGDRSVTNVPSQSLFLMNSPFVVEQSKSLASQVLAAADDDGGRVDAAYRMAFCRAATPDERAAIDKYLSRSSDKEKQWAEICQTLLASAEFRYVE